MKANILRRALSVFSTLVLFVLLVAPSVSAAANNRQAAAARSGSHRPKITADIAMNPRPAVI